MEVVKLRDLTFKQTKKEISDYLKQKIEATNAQIADDLRMDIVLVNKALNALWKTGVVEPTN
jgi:predicted ArsR family transcriptional regulator